jgi:hypothetical protein
MLKTVGLIVVIIAGIEILWRLLVREWLRAIINGPKRSSGFSRNGIKAVRRAGN